MSRSKGSYCLHLCLYVLGHVGSVLCACVCVCASCLFVRENQGIGRYKICSYPFIDVAV